MTSTFVSPRRITAIAAAITLFVAPIASAQSPEGAPSSAASANTALLSPAAFARLVQRPPADAVPAPVAKVPPRLELLHYGTTVMARQATAVKAPQQKSWASRHKTALIWIAIGAVGVLYVHHLCDLDKCGPW